MKISTKGRYALEALTYMASLDSDLPIKIKTVSDGTQISEKYLEQIFFLLRKKGILDTRRGPDGGYYLAKDIHSLTAGEIVRSVEPQLVPVVCVGDLNLCKSKIRSHCVTRPLWLKLSDTIANVLDGITLNELKNSYLKKVAENK